MYLSINLIRLISVYLSINLFEHQPIFLNPPPAPLTPRLTTLTQPMNDLSVGMRFKTIYMNSPLSKSSVSEISCKDGMPDVQRCRYPNLKP